MTYELNRKREKEFNNRIEEMNNVVHLSEQELRTRERLDSLEKKVLSLEETVKQLNYNGCVFIRRKKD